MSARTAAAAVVDVILRDGSTLRLRAPAEGDAESLLDFFDGLSERSRYQRFHGVRRLDLAFVEPYLDPDWVTRGALAGAALGGGHRARRGAGRVRPAARPERG